MNAQPLPRAQVIALVQYNLDQNDPDKAVEIAKENKSCLADHELFNYEFGAVLVQLGRPVEAADFLLASFRLNPDREGLGAQLISTLKEAGRPHDAINVLWTLFERKPENIDWLEELEYLYRSVGNTDTADRVTGVAAAVRGDNSSGRPHQAKIKTINEIRKVALIAPRPRARSWKIAKAIKHFGAEVVYVYPRTSPPQQDDLFDDQYAYGSFKELRDLLHNIQSEQAPDVYHVFCDGSGYLEAAILMSFLDEPVVWDYYDFVNVAYNLDKATEYELSTSLERWCMAEADAICARNLEIQFAKRRGFERRNKNIIFFPDYCHNTVDHQPKLGEADGRLHIYVSEPIQESGEDINHPETLRPVIENLLQLDFIQVYVCPSQSLGHDLDKHFPGYVKLTENNDNLSIRATSSETDYLEDISRYDIMLAGFSRLNPGYDQLAKISKEHMQYYYAGKFADCLDADTLFCIPHCEYLEFNAWLAERMGVCLRPDPNMLGDRGYWESVLRNVRSHPVNFERQRTEWSIVHHADRLKDFYLRTVQTVSST